MLVTASKVYEIVVALIVLGAVLAVAVAVVAIIVVVSVPVMIGQAVMGIFNPRYNYD